MVIRKGFRVIRNRIEKKWSSTVFETWINFNCFNQSSVLTLVATKVVFQIKIVYVEYTYGRVCFVWNGLHDGKVMIGRHMTTSARYGLVSYEWISIYHRFSTAAAAACTVAIDVCIEDFQLTIEQSGLLMHIAYSMPIKVPFYLIFRISYYVLVHADELKRSFLFNVLHQWFIILLVENYLRLVDEFQMS